MNIDFFIWLSVGSISMIVLSVSLFFHDKRGARPARLAFRVFSLATLALFVSIAAAGVWDTPIIRLIADISIIILAVSLLLGILWRSQSAIPDSVVYLWALAFVIDKMLLTSNSSAPSYLLETIGALIAAYALFKRPNRNAADKGMMWVLLAWTGIYVFEFSSVINMELVGSQVYSMENTLALVLAPTYISGFVIFFISSFILDAQNELSLVAAIDSKTGLFKRYHFLDEAQKLLNSATRNKPPMSVLICDIDHFKQMNDQHGHDTGDKVIKAFSECLARIVTPNDILARYGDGKFVILQSQTNDLAAMLVAKRMCEEADALRIKIHHGSSVRFTVSFGVCQITDFDDIQTSVIEANTAMQEAKSNGRNRVSLYENSGIS